jgi:hypothetical protein
MKPKHEGPDLIVSREERCGFCCHHEQVMVRSGLKPIYDHYCQHPQCVTGLTLSWEPKGRKIGGHDVTPIWCPVLAPQSREGEG